MTVRIATGVALRLAVCLCALAGFMAASAAVAQALTVHVYKSSFGEPGSGPGQLGEPSGIAVNDSTSLSPTAGDVYVVDRKNNRVERFNATGTYLGEFNGGGTYEVEGKTETGAAAPTGAFSKPTQIAVDDSNDPLDPSAEDVYVIDQNHAVVDKFTATGAYLGQIDGSETAQGRFNVGLAYGERSLEGVAVDPKGVLWLGIGTHGAPGPELFSFTNAETNELATEGTDKYAQTGQIAVDGEGDLYIDTYDAYAKLTSTGVTLREHFGGVEGKKLVAVDSTHGEVYLGGNEAIEAFDLAGNPIESEVGGAPAPSFGSGHLSELGGIAVNASTGAVYATNSSTDSVAMFEAVTLPSAVLGAPGDRHTRSVTLNGTVNPEGAPVSSCVFEYDTRPYAKGEAPHGSSVPCSPGNLGSGRSSEGVSANLTGLTPETTYYYQLVVTNAGGTARTPGAELFTGPKLSDEYAVNAGSTSVTLNATIDTDGADTHYYVEYGFTTAYGQYAPAPPPGGDLGAASGPQQIVSHIARLTPGATYHYRLVAVQDGETFAQPDHTFVTQAAGLPATLADERHWELVSPAKKGGALFEPTELGGAFQAAADGSAITYLVVGPVAVPATGSYKFSQLLSRRGSSGWNTTDLTLPREIPENEEPALQIGSATFEYTLFSPNLSLGLVHPPTAGTPPLAPGVTERTIYLLNTAKGVFTPLVGPFDTPEGTTLEEPGTSRESLETNSGEWQLHVAAETPDLAHVVIVTPKALTSEAVDEETAHRHEKGTPQQNLYEWGEGELQLVNFLPEGPVAHGAYGAHAPFVQMAGTQQSYGGSVSGPARAISADGRRIAWTWGHAPYSGVENEEYRGLFVRDMVEGRTVRVGGPHALYQTMNASGSLIFYTEAGELHLFEFETGRDLDLTATHGAEPSAGIQDFISDVSEDGSYVYFVASGVLAAGGERGADNLYVLHESAGVWTTRFIAQLSQDDRPTWEASSQYGSPELARISSRVSPNGRFLAFMSDRSLTGYDNIDAASGQPDEEVYEYDFASGRLVCASCNPSNVRPYGIFDSETTEPLVDRYGVWTEKASDAEDPYTAHWIAANIPGWDGNSYAPTAYQPRYLSDSGRLFFDSSDALVPRDTNGVEDVYEFEPEGVGACSTATSSSMWVYVRELAGHPVDGCVGLISSGTSAAESAFYDASESGNDVFFITTSRLAVADFDTAYDIYDAHVCTSAVPCRTEPVAPPPCSSGDGCKPSPTPQPEFYGAPATETFHGIGNLTQSAIAPTVGSTKPLTSARKRTLALKACRKLKRKPRAVCERRVRARYAVRRHAHSTGKAGSR